MQNKKKEGLLLSPAVNRLVYDTQFLERIFLITKNGAKNNAVPNGPLLKKYP